MTSSVTRSETCAATARFNSLKDDRRHSINCYYFLLNLFSNVTMCISIRNSLDSINNICTSLFSYCILNEFWTNLIFFFARVTQLLLDSYWIAVFISYHHLRKNGRALFTGTFQHSVQRILKKYILFFKTVFKRMYNYCDLFSSNH